MTFFLDANILIYSAVDDSEYREPCLEILEAVAAGRADGSTSTAALEEVWHVETSGRAGKLKGLTERAYLLLTPLLPVTDAAFRIGLSLRVATLETNDRLHVGTCMDNAIDVIVSADSGFDGVAGIRRVDPLSEKARHRLLGSGR